MSELLACPTCDSTDLTPDTYDMPILVKHRDWDGPTVLVKGLEFYWCRRCGRDPAFPDQIKRNEARIAAARAASNTISAQKDSV